MATEMNKYQKLAMIRQEFQKTGVKKSGMNLHAEFQYFELRDFVGPATEILNKYHCLFTTTFDGNVAKGTLTDWDTGSAIDFSFPCRNIAEPAKFRMNEAQACGAELTYFRRYLWFLMLDISNADEFDSGEHPVKPNAPEAPKPAPAPTPAPVPLAAPKPERKKPATVQERKEIKQELTGVNDKASEIQINALKEALGELLDKDPEQENFVQEIVLKTNGLTEVTKAQAEQLIMGLADILMGYDAK